MKGLQLIRTLHHLQMLRPKSLYQFIVSWFHHGTNLMMLLAFIAKWKPEEKMLTVDGEGRTYSQMLNQSLHLAHYFNENYGITKGMRVAFVCYTELQSIQALFAVSRLGASCHLLNPEMSTSQLEQVLNQGGFDYVIWGLKEEVVLGLTVIDFTTIPQEAKHSKLKRTNAAPIVLQTGGTTGPSKQARHQPSVTSYLVPFRALLQQLNLLSKKAVYCATPLYHGYGLALLIACLAAGKPIVLTRKFSVEIALQLIEQHKVDMVSAVPLMVDRLMRTDASCLNQLTCIASGGAELSPKVTRTVQKKLGLVLYNLYGTSETGLNMIATPEDLACSPETIGRSLPGMELLILNPTGNQVGPGEIGEFHVKNTWSMTNATTNGQATGDLGYRDVNGLHYLVGRTDSRIDSAGETVYPLTVEQVLLQHPIIRDVVVFPVQDIEYGTRLEASIVLEANAELSEAEVQAWLKLRLARYEIPRAIHFTDKVTYTTLGKKVRQRLVTTSQTPMR